MHTRLLLTRVLSFLALSGALAVGALAAESRLRPRAQWPYAALRNLQGGAFRPAPGAACDLDALAAQARRELPGYTVLVESHFDTPELVIGRTNGGFDLTPLVAWRDRGGLPLEAPREISMGCSAPDWFSAPRRTHDMVVAGTACVLALGLLGFATVAAERRRDASPAAPAVA